MPFPIQSQEQSLWCWAAVSMSVDHFFNPAATSTQCQIARGVLGVSHDCCGNRGSCNRTAKLQDALRSVKRLREPLLAGLRLSFEDVKREIDNDRPVCVRVGWFGGGAHFVIISGYQFTATGAPLVEVSDPLYPDSTILYDTFVSNYLGAGRWTDTYQVQP